MPRYKANVLFGPWRAGEIFESEDAFHAMLAKEGRILSELSPKPVVPASNIVTSYPAAQATISVNTTTSGSFSADTSSYEKPVPEQDED